MMGNPLGEKLKVHQGDKSLRDFAAELEISHSQLAKLLKSDDAVPITTRMMIKIAKGLSLPLSTIYALASQGQTQARPFARVKQDARELGVDPETLTSLPDNHQSKRKQKARSSRSSIHNAILIPSEAPDSSSYANLQKNEREFRDYLATQLDDLLNNRFAPGRDRLIFTGLRVNQPIYLSADAFHKADIVLHFLDTANNQNFLVRLDINAILSTSHGLNTTDQDIKE